MATLSVPQLLQESAAVICQQAAASKGQGLHQLAATLGRQVITTLDNLAACGQQQQVGHV
jgi:hypothetical protein